MNIEQDWGLNHCMVGYGLGNLVVYDEGVLDVHTKPSDETWI
jgi:hypothetical protein